MQICMGRTKIYCTGITRSLSVKLITEKLSHIRGDWFQIVNDDKGKYGIVESDNSNI